VAASMFGCATLMLFAFIYWQTADYESDRIDLYLRYEAETLAHTPISEISSEISTKFAGDLHRTTFAALFGADGRPVAGDVVRLPSGLTLEGRPQRARTERIVNGNPAMEVVRAIGVRLSDGRILLIGRSEAGLTELRSVITRALALGLIPAVGLALLAGTLASLRVLERVRDMNQAVERIMKGGWQARLPVRNSADALDQMAAQVNRMLDDIERLLLEVRGVGDAVAHDLRTPLARLRSRLEGGRRRAHTQRDLEDVVDRALVDLDQTFGVITALLRIGEIEGARRRAGFGDVSLAAMLTEAADLYQPVAELRGISLDSLMPWDRTVVADRDLLFEAVANLTDNAVKFTPDGGHVRLSLTERAGSPVMCIEDSGSGIPEAEQAVVLQRFYRADRSRHIAGNGLGLNLVTAILRLHGFGLTMRNLNPGFSMEIMCSDQTADVTDNPLKLEYTVPSQGTRAQGGAILRVQQTDDHA
jgi:signal transduction histidine kinase